MTIKLNLSLIDNLLLDAVDQVYIGYSGGMDSHVLLHLAAFSQYRDKVTAVYVHHGLQTEADDWAQHCNKIATELGVHFQAIKVDARPEVGQSPEDAAREARYGAFKTLLQQGDALLVAQHRDDQLETVLLQLCRGAGVEGLAAMPQSMSLGDGILLRPFLNISLQTLQHYAEQHQLHWIEDPSNRSLDFDRNFLRHQVIPILKKRWPGLDKTVARTARHCGSVSGWIKQQAGQNLEKIIQPDDSIDLQLFQQFSTEEQVQIIRHWFHAAGLKYPRTAIVEAVLTEMIAARSDANPLICTQNHQIRRYQNRLFLIPDGRKNSCSEYTWPDKALVLQLENGDCLSLLKDTQGIPVEQWQAATVMVRFRQGGEKLALPGRKGRHSLKKLFQEWGVPPWLRDSVPLVYLDGQLVAVAGFCISAEIYCDSGEDCYQLEMRQFSGKKSR